MGITLNTIVKALMKKLISIVDLELIFKANLIRKVITFPLMNDKILVRQDLIIETVYL